MTALLGKRKRRDNTVKPNGLGDPKENPDEVDRLQSLLRQHFETKFEALESFDPVPTGDTTPIEKLDAETYDSDWTGFSEEAEGDNAAVVDYQQVEISKAKVSGEHSKSFMSSKPPLQSDEYPSTTQRIGLEPTDPDETATDAANLKKDLALQRLLEESHLLDPTSSLALSGQNRHKAFDIRQQALGSKSSMFSQKKMPLAQRRGILSKASEREESRRSEAKENGIVLEKTVKPKHSARKRQRAIGAPTVGRFTHGVLTLSKKDVDNIVGRPKKIPRR